MPRHAGLSVQEIARYTIKRGNNRSPYFALKKVAGTRGVGE